MFLTPKTHCFRRSMIGVSTTNLGAQFICTLCKTSLNGIHVFVQ